MNDLDLAEIEAHLYSQIYHSNIEESTEENALVSQESDKEMRRTNRYYQDVPNFGNRYQNKRFQRSPNPNFNKSNTGEQTYLKEKDYSKPHQNSPMNRPNQNKTANVLIEPSISKEPCNRINNFDKATKRRLKKAQWMEKREQRRKEEAEMIERNAKKTPVRIHKRFENEEAGDCLGNEVITLSDSDENDDDAVIEIPGEQIPVLAIIDSEDEQIPTAEPATEELRAPETEAEPILASKTNSDDVIFVELPPEEIINLDEDPIVEKTVELTNKNLLVQATSNTPNGSSLTYQPHERSELLRTPDSTSNDFMINPPLTSTQTNFNFSLHGADFRNSEVAKPCRKNEISCETESSSSTTTDLRSLNFNATVFSEIEFPREDIFADGNLESFGNFITPVRNKNESILQSTPNEIVSESRISLPGEEEESEEETSKVRKSRQLPNLCHMDLPIKKLKKTTLNSKFDLLDQEKAEMEMVTESKKKKRKSLDVHLKKKTKKKKVSECLSKEEEMLIESVLNKRRKNKNKKKKVEYESLDNFDLFVKEEKPRRGKSTNESEHEEVVQRKKKRSDSLNSGQEPQAEIEYAPKERKKRKSETVTNLEPITPSRTEVNQEEVVVKERKKKRSESVQANEEISKEAVESEKMADILPSVNENSKVAKTIEEPIAVISNIQSGSEVEISLQDNPVQLSVKDGNVKISPEPTLGEKDALVVEQPTVEFPVLGKQLRVKVEGELVKDLQVIDESFDEEDVIISLIESNDDSDDSNLSSLAADEAHDIQLLNLSGCEKTKDAFAIDSTPTPDKLSLRFNTLEEVQATMTSNSHSWSVLDTDRMKMPTNRRMRRCNRCKEVGHMAVKCTNEVSVKCRLCGWDDHYEPRCPNRICLQCGAKNKYTTITCRICYRYRDYKCGICSEIGHGEKLCPDVWRRYYLTTADGPPERFKGPNVEPPLNCSRCSRVGHLEHRCRYGRSTYPPSNPFIIAHTDDLAPKLKIHDRLGPVSPRLPPRLSPLPQPFLPPPLVSQSLLPPPHLPSLMPPLPLQLPSQEQFLKSPFFQSPLIPPLMAVNLGFPKVFKQPILPNTNQPLVQLDNQQNLDIGNQKFVSQPTLDDLRQINFQDTLPGFISFDDGVSVQAPSAFIQQLPASSEKAIIRPNMKYSEINAVLRAEKHNQLFSGSSVNAIKTKITKDMKKLVKMRKNIRNVKRHLKSKLSTNMAIPNKFYKTLNMIIFGIYTKFDGGVHMQRLQEFMDGTFVGLSEAHRDDLAKAYKYVFGIDQHKDIDYRRQLSIL